MTDNDSNVRNSLDLREIEERGRYMISLIHTSQILIVVASTTLTLAKRMKNISLVDCLSQIFRSILSISVLCETGLDILSKFEIDPRILFPENLPALHLFLKEIGLLNH